MACTSSAAWLCYSASTVVCVAHAISEGGSLVLGAQAGEARLRRCSGRRDSHALGALPRRRSIWFWRCGHDQRGMRYVTAGVGASLLPDPRRAIVTSPPRHAIFAR